VVTLDTVKKHVSHLLGKLGAANRTEAVTRARDLGVIPQRGAVLKGRAMSVTASCCESARPAASSIPHPSGSIAALAGAR
jgi:hypothetical protein